MKSMPVTNGRRHVVWLLLLALACSPPAGMPQSPESVDEGVVFRLRAPGAVLVQLSGSWMSNSWSRGLDWSGGTRVGVMQRSPEDAAIWELTVPLGTGRYEYLFLVDGRFWELDPANPQRTADGQDGWVSLLVVP
jgi:hypothetical protein